MVLVFDSWYIHWEVSSLERLEVKEPHKRFLVWCVWLASAFNSWSLFAFYPSVTLPVLKFALLKHCRKIKLNVTLPSDCINVFFCRPLVMCISASAYQKIMNTENNFDIDSRIPVGRVVRVELCPIHKEYYKTYSLVGMFSKLRFKWNSLYTGTGWIALLLLHWFSANGVLWLPTWSGQLGF